MTKLLMACLDETAACFSSNKKLMNDAVGMTSSQEDSDPMMHNYKRAARGIPLSTRVISLFGGASCDVWSRAEDQIDGYKDIFPQYFPLQNQFQMPIREVNSLLYQSFSSALFI